jgi:O-antigen ligase
LGSLLVLFYAPEVQHSPWPWPDFFVIAFVVSLLLSILRSGHVPVSLLTSTPFLPTVLIYLLLSRFMSDTYSLWLVYAGGSVGAALVAVTVLVGAWAGPTDPTLLVKSLPTAVLVEPNDVLMLAVIVPLMLVASLTAKSLWTRSIALFGVSVCFAAIVVVHSRAALLAAVLGVLVVLAFQGVRWMWLAMLSACIGLLATDALRGFPMLLKFANRDLFCNRLPLWAAAVRLWYEAPFFGHGADSYRDLYRQQISAIDLPICALVDHRLTPWPHNLFLELLASQGLVGTLPYLALIIWCFKRAYVAAHRVGSAHQLLAVGLLGSLSAFCLAALVELTFLRYWVVIVASTLIGLTASLESFSATHRLQAP